MQAQLVQLYLLGSFYQMKAMLGSCLTSLLPFSSSPYLLAHLSIAGIVLQSKDIAKAILLQNIVYTVQDDIEVFSPCSQRISRLAEDALKRHLTHKNEPSLVPYYNHPEVHSCSHSSFKNPVLQVRNRSRSTSLGVQLRGENKKARVLSHEIIYRDLKLLLQHIRGLEIFT